MRIRPFGLSVLLTLCISAPAFAQTPPATPVPLPDVCGTVADKPVCVPASIFAATFKDWKPGDISPLAIEQASHSDTYARWRNAEHQLAAARAELAKATAPKEAEGLEAIRANWLKSVQAAAPDGTVYDEKAGKYIPKPIVKADEKPAEKPKPGGGGM